jgi:prepilin-type N-terminal cleavage/methylation domain-containing protein
MFQYNRKGFTLVEMLIGIAVISILISGVMFAFKPFVKQYFYAQENVTGEIYQLAYDIQKNKTYSKRFYVSEEGDSLKLFRSQTCYAIYSFLEDDKKIKKSITCTNEERLPIDNTIIVPNIKYAHFEKNGRNIKFDINMTIQKYSHNFEF